MDEKFHSYDRDYSKAKRTLLRNVLGAIFPFYWRSNWTSITSNGVVSEAKMNYLDAFGGQGNYDKEKQSKEDVKKYGSPIIAVHKALEAVATLSTREFDQIFEGGRLYLVDFVFNDKRHKILSKLKKAVEERFKLFDWEAEPEETGERARESVIVYGGPITTRDAEVRHGKIRVQYFNQDFDALALEDIPSPLFSFVDPIGVKPVPMDAMIKLMGPSREIFINVMVATIHRLLPRPDIPALEQFYGELSDENKEAAASLAGKEKCEFLVDLYRDALDINYKKRHPLSDGYMSCKFAMRKSTLSDEKGTLYYMVFASSKLNFIAKCKAAMMKVTDVAEELAFSVYRRKNNPIDYERKTTDANEADLIFEAFRGERPSFGDVREFILLATPFAFHSKALKYLEDHLGIVDVETCPAKRGRMGKFPCEIPHDSTHALKPEFGTNWRILFNDEYRPEDEERKEESLLGRWLSLKIKSRIEHGSACDVCDADYVKRNEILAVTPSRLKKALRTSGINTILQKLNDDDVIRLDGRFGKEQKIYWVGSEKKTGSYRDR